MCVCAWGGGGVVVVDTVPVFVFPSPITQLIPVFLQTKTTLCSSSSSFLRIVWISGPDLEHSYHKVSDPTH
jgi:hypothetical protein